MRSCARALASAPHCARAPLPRAIRGPRKDPPRRPGRGPPRPQASATLRGRGRFPSRLTYKIPDARAPWHSVQALVFTPFHTSMYMQDVQYYTGAHSTALHWYQLQATMLLCHLSLGV